VRQQRPDFVIMQTWGVMTATAIKEAVATGYPREKMFGVWWAAAEPDVQPVGADAKGYNGLGLHGIGRTKVHEDIIKFVHDKGQASGPKDEVGSVLYNRGMISAMLAVEGVRRAQERYGKKPLTGEQIRWGLENLAIDQKKLDAMGLGTMIKPLSTSCKDHGGSHFARVQTWDGKQWSFTSDWYEADQQIILPMAKRSSTAYLAEKKLPRRDCAKELTSG
jgi:branched-chain amino acid transport system substrate-binding protein